MVLPFLTQPHACHLCFRRGGDNFPSQGGPPAGLGKVPGLGHGAFEGFMWGSTGRSEQVPLNFNIPGIEVVPVSGVNLSGIKKSGKGISY